MKNKLATLLTIAILATPATAFAVGKNQMKIQSSYTSKSIGLSGLYGSDFTKDKVKASLQKNHCKKRKVLIDFKVGKKTSEGTPFTAKCVKKK